MRRITALFIFLIPILTPLALWGQPKITQIPRSKKSGVDEVQMARDAKSGNIFILVNDVESERSFGPTPKTKYLWDVEVLSPDFKQLHAGVPQALQMPKGTDAAVGQLLSLKGQTSVLFLLYDKKQEISKVYQAPVSAKDGIGSLAEIGSLAGEYHIPSQLKVAYSADSSLFMIAQFPITHEFKQPYAFLVLDQTGKVVRKGNLSIPSEASPRLVGTPVLANDGSIWAPVWHDEKDFRQEVWVWREGAAKPQIIDVAPSTTQVATNLLLIQSPYDGLIYGGGTYATASGNGGKSIFKKVLGAGNGDQDPEQGTFMLKINNKDGQVMVKSVHEFSASTLNFWGQKPESLKKGNGIDWIRATQIVPLRDGSLWLGTEQAFLTVETGKVIFNNAYYGQEAFQGKRGEPVTESAILTHYSTSGDIIQETVMGKRTWSYDYFYFGYFLAANSQGDLLALYTDHVDNIGKANAKAANLSKIYMGGNGDKDARAAMFTVTSAGKSTSSLVFKEKGKNSIMSGISVQIAPNAFAFFYDASGDKYGIVKVEW